jgi:hypothetical protein
MKSIIKFFKVISYHLTTEKYHKSKANIGFSDEDLQNDQRKLDVELIGLNADIKLENSRKQSGLLKGCFTISWHNSHDFPQPLLDFPSLP